LYGLISSGYSGIQPWAVAFSVQMEHRSTPLLGDKK
jgi:hypothetical protein